MSLRFGANRLVRIDPIKTGSQPYLQFCIILIIYETPRQGWLAEGFRFTSNASRIFVFRSLFVLYLLFVCGLMRTSLALAIASISSGFAKRVLYPLKAPAALGTMWRTQPSGTGWRTNRGFWAQYPPNPQVYPSHKTTFLSRRRCVLPQPAQATAISGSPFLFLLTVEILICDSSQEIPLFLRNLFQRLFLVSKDRCSFVSSSA